MKKTLAPFWNIVLAYLCFMLCRVVFVWQNSGMVSFGGMTAPDLWRAFRGAMLFDTSAICYTLGIYAVMMLLPLRVRDRAWYQSVCKWYYIIVISLCIVANLTDGVYFPYSERRATPASLTEFQNEGAANLFKIVGIEILNNWYLVLFAVALIVALCFLYKKGGDLPEMKSREMRVSSRCLAVVIWLLVIPLTICGIRGGFTRKTRPINIGNAMRYVDTPAQAAAILNTPFSFIRNISNKGYDQVSYMLENEVPRYYSAVHRAGPGRWTGKDKPNVMIIIMESFSQEFIGAYNTYPCSTPFLDSLKQVSLCPVEGFANGNKSIDALASILTSVPRLEEHFFVTPYVNNRMNSIVTELAYKGYSSSFFYGSSPGSMGFDAYTSAVGTEHSYSMEDYCRDPEFNGKDDYDGTWAIWDEDFMQFTAKHLGDHGEPFVSTLFTASSHHPFVIPEKYKDTFSRPGHPMYSCISYTDHALKLFFERASKEPWYDNTIFVLTADHTSTVAEREEYKDDLGSYRVPIMIFDPSGTLPRGIIAGMGQQIDIFPTVMGILGADRDYVAFGRDMLDEESREWVYVYKEIHSLYTKNGFFCFDGENAVGDSQPDPEDMMFLKAFIQDYKSRMISNNMTIDKAL